MKRFQHYIKTTSIISTAVLLSACGSSNSSNQPNPIEYLSFGSTDAVTVGMEGRVGTYTGTSRPVTGSYTYDTKSTTVEGMTDSDGADNNGVFVDDTNPANGGAIITGQYDEVDAYDYVIPIQFSDANNPNQRSNRGYIGIPTAAQDIPTSGFAIFKGTAGGNVSGGDWHKTPATLTANFGSAGGTVDFTATSTLTDPNYSPTNVRNITVTGGTITGNKFSGGTVTGTLNGAPADISSTGTPLIEGQFFGYNETDSTPGDAGMMITTSGADGKFDLAFTGTTID